MVDNTLYPSFGGGRTLAQAIVDTIREPLLVLDADLRVVVASRSFYVTFGVNRQNTEGQMLHELGDGQWDIPALRRLLESVISERAVMDAYEVEHEFPTLGRRTMLLNARRVLDEGNGRAVLLLAIEDDTERRAAEREKEELLRQKDMLLREMQHRVANSLQIIASILMLKARTVRSKVTRGHLHEAHQRVLSLVTVQKHLQTSGHGEQVQIASYLSNLCGSLAGSMIGDRRPITLTVRADPGTANSGVAVSLGLITTELVINALKHAFPGGEGNVIVAYKARGAGWRLSVSDDGVGRPAGQPDKGGGLGTSIVEALAHQLDARVEISDGHPGTTVSIAHAA